MTKRISEAEKELKSKASKYGVGRGCQSGCDLRQCHCLIPPPQELFLFCCKAFIMILWRYNNNTVRVKKKKKKSWNFSSCFLKDSRDILE